MLVQIKQPVMRLKSNIRRKKCIHCNDSNCASSFKDCPRCGLPLFTRLYSKPKDYYSKKMIR